jgi:hypothetical protein
MINELKKRFKQFWASASDFEKSRLKTTNKIYKFKDGLITAWPCSSFYKEEK